MSNRLNKFGEELGELLSFNMICNISFISDIPVDYISSVENSFKLDNKIDELLKEENISIKNYLNRFNYKELIDKYNITISNDLNDYSILRSIFKYLRITDPKQLYKPNNCILYKSKNDKPELLHLWLEHCYRTVLDEKVEDYSKGNIDNLVKFINEEAINNRFDKNRLIKEFNKNGILLAIEPDLKGSKIRGAFRVLNNTPAIYITTKHKRIGDVYFALLHELAHCKSDFNRAKSGSFVSLMEDNSEEEYEIKADKTALNWMVKDKDYEEILKSNKYKYYNMPFLVYRLALDKKISYSSDLYQNNNKLITIDR